MSSVSLVWITPKAEQVIAYCARVSNPTNQHNHATAPKLLKYCIDHQHWSPFEMASMCLEISTQRDIAAQILRHRSFSFQEFSTRYSDVSGLGYSLPDLRLQDTKNRQNSLPIPEDMNLENVQAAIQLHLDKGQKLYQHLLSIGVAKECARRLLPLCQNTRLYMTGTVRSWIHYCQLRTNPDTQLEHRQIANQAQKILQSHIPSLI